MKKRLLPLLVLTLLLMAVAPSAMAHHCSRCRPAFGDCLQVWNFGYEYCEFDGFDSCYLENYCGDHVNLASTPLAAEFAVASVERLDEPQPDETRIAAGHLARPHTR